MAKAPEAAAQRWEATGMLASATDSMVQGPYAAMAALTQPRSSVSKPKLNGLQLSGPNAYSRLRFQNLWQNQTAF